MPKENKTVELNDEELEKVTGGDGIEILPDVLVNNWYINGPNNCIYVKQIIPNSWTEIRGCSFYNNCGNIEFNLNALISFKDFKNNYTLSTKPDWLPSDIRL